MSGTIVSDQVRLLHRDSMYAYTNNPGLAMPREPEAIHEFDQKRLSEKANQTREILMADELARKRTRSRSARLTQYEREARNQGRDASRFTDVFDRTLLEFQQWLSKGPN